jgi:hypothetical protein
MQNTYNSSSLTQMRDLLFCTSQLLDLDAPYESGTSHYALVLLSYGFASIGRTKSSPHRAVLQLSIPYRCEEPYDTCMTVLQSQQTMHVSIVNDPPVFECQ